MLFPRLALYALQAEKQVSFCFGSSPLQHRQLATQAAACDRSELPQVDSLEPHPEPEMSASAVQRHSEGDTLWMEVALFV